MKTVDYRWWPEQIAAFCERESYWILEIATNAEGEELAELCGRHAAGPARYNPFISKIAEHANAPAHVLLEILAAFSGDGEFASAPATKRNTPRPVLEVLTRSPFKPVREHAELNLRRARA